MKIEDFFGLEGPLAKKFEGYIPRPQQIELASGIEKAMQTGRPLMGEAPTGVGKSLAALVPAFRLIQREDAPVVVVTSSILLQEQYFYKDIPLLEDIMGFKVNSVLMKGKSNYLCLEKMVNRRAGAQNTTQASEIDEILKWSDQTKTGDVSELDFVPSYGVWSDFAITDKHECAGKECPLFNHCHYYNNRRKMNSAKLIICNYHYYFTALNIEGMLPPGVRAVIFDEGHEIPAIARDMEEREYRFDSFKKINQMLITAQKKAEAHLGSVGIADEIELPALIAAHQKLFEDLTRYYHEHRPKDKEKWPMYEHQRKTFHGLGKDLLTCYDISIEALDIYLRRTGMDIDDRGSWDYDHTKEEVDWVFALYRYKEGLEERRHLAQIFFGSHPPDLPYEVLNWMEMPPSGNLIVFHSKPFNAAPITGPIFNVDGPSNVMMGDFTPIIISATLSVNNTFQHLKDALGIKTMTSDVIVSSPFNLKDNLLWYLPKDMPAGNDMAHLPAALNEMEKIIKVLDGRTLCLFTSIRAMQSAINHFTKILPKHIKVIAQGDMTKKKIIETMRNNPHTVVIATKSFFTGVDVQGQNLSAVLIDKLPFPMIGDPINDYLMESERGFWRHTLPEVVITMKQGFGRLNRTVDDKGVVAVLDGRLSTAGYKNRIFDSFNFEVTATRDFERVKSYLEEIIHVNS